MESVCFKTGSRLSFAQPGSARSAVLHLQTLDRRRKPRIAKTPAPLTWLPPGPDHTGHQTQPLCRVVEPQPLAQPDTQPDLRSSAKSFCGAPARWRAAALGSPGHLSHGEAGPAALRHSCSSHYDSSPAGPGHVSVQSRTSQGSPDTPWEPLLQIQLFCSISLAFPLLPSWRIHQTVPLLLNCFAFLWSACALEMGFLPWPHTPEVCRLWFISHAALCSGSNSLELQPFAEAWWLSNPGTGLHPRDPAIPSTGLEAAEINRQLRGYFQPRGHTRRDGQRQAAMLNATQSVTTLVTSVKPLEPPSRIAGKCGCVAACFLSSHLRYPASSGA